MGFENEILRTNSKPMKKQCFFNESMTNEKFRMTKSEDAAVAGLSGHFELDRWKSSMN